MTGRYLQIPATHEVVNGNVTLAEPLTNSQIEKALAKGLQSNYKRKDQIWTEAINTLITKRKPG